MKTRKGAFFFSLLMLTAVASYSQLVSDVKRRPVKVGDTISDIIFKNIVNYDKQELRLSDFKGRLIVIDIWNKWCVSCIAGFPKNEKLEEKFRGRLQFLLLTSNTRQELTELMDRSEIVKNTRLPYILSDTLVNNLFPHLGVPHHIWIDSNFVVRAVTNGTTEDMLEEFFKTGSTESVRKRDNDLIDFNDRVPLLFEGKGRLQKYIQSYSLFMSSLPDYPFNDAMGYYVDTAGIISTNRVRFINVSMRDLLFFIFENINIKFNFPGGDKYIPQFLAEDGDNNEYVKNYTYCYELLLPSSYGDSLPEIRKQAIKKKMKDDIANNFGFKFSVKKIEYECLDLISTGPIKSQPEIIGKTPLDENIGNEWNIKYYSAPALPIVFQRIMKSDIPIIDKTGVKGKIDLKLYIERRDLLTLNRELSKYKLRLIPSKIVRPTTIVTK